MRTFWILYTFHVKEMLKKKGFLFSSLFMMGLIFISSYFSYQANQPNQPDGLETVWVSAVMEGVELPQKEMQEALKISGYDLVFVDKTTDELTESVQKEEVKNAFYMGGTTEKPELVHMYHLYSAEDVTLYMENFLQDAALTEILSDAGLTKASLDTIYETFTFSTEAVQKTEQTYGLVFPLTFLMYVFVMGFGQTISMNVVSEKSTKVIEMLLPKIKPAHSFYAKIAGSLTIGLMQLGTTLLSFVAVRLLGWVNGGAMNFIGIQISYADVTVGTIGLFLFFFLAMFFFYGLLYASLGSKVSRVEDLSPLLTPIVFLILGAFGLGIFTVFSPESTISSVASYIPFFSPIVLFARILLDVATTTEIALSLLILFASILLLTKWCSKWFAEGISHYGKGKKKV